MTNDQRAPIGMRMYGMMQHLLTCFAQGIELDIPQPRDVVTKQDALDAVLQLAAAIDEQAQANAMDTERAVWVIQLLMVIREYIEPLPRGLAKDGVTDSFTADLQEMVEAIKTAHGRQLNP